MKLQYVVAVVLSFAGTVVLAKVTPEEAARLKSDLMPLGGEKAANKDGTIPAWAGGLTQAPACYKGEGKRYCDPFPQDKAKFTITAQNVAQYKAKLSEGQLAMFRK